jgi:outer membrane biosynthesis protein TonB
MRPTIRLFMAAILFTAVAGVASAQDASAAPPPPAPDVAQPVAELPTIPFAEPNPPAVEPALTLGQDALTVEPAPPATVDPLVAEKPVTTTTKRVTTKKTARKPAAKAEIQVSESLQVTAPAASTAPADTAANPPPPNAAASTAPLKSIAPPQPAADTVAVEETKFQTTMGIGGWLLAGIAVAALAGIITLLRRRQTKRRTSIVDFTTVSPKLKPALAPRP